MDPLQPSPTDAPPTDSPPTERQRGVPFSVHRSPFSLRSSHSHQDRPLSFSSRLFIPPGFSPRPSSSSRGKLPDGGRSLLPTPSPLPSRRAGEEEIVAVALQGKVAQGLLSPKIRPPPHITFDPWLEPHLPHPERRKARQGGQGNPRRYRNPFFLHGRDGFRRGEGCSVVVEKVISGWRGGGVADVLW